MLVHLDQKHKNIVHLEQEVKFNMGINVVLIITYDSEIQNINE